MISNADKDRDLCLTEKMKACVEANGGTAGCFAMFPGEEQKKSLKPKDVPANTECIFVPGGKRSGIVKYPAHWREYGNSGISVRTGRNYGF